VERLDSRLRGNDDLGSSARSRSATGFLPSQ